MTNPTFVYPGPPIAPRSPRASHMAPLRTASVSHRPSVRFRTRRLSSSREDHSDLVGFRYEQTKQAEPPIPFPPPPQRCVSVHPRSSVTPIVVVCPAIPPPPENHPLFRQEPHLHPRPQTISIVSDVESRRDSCAPTSSSITLQDNNDSDSDRSLSDAKIIEKALDCPSSDFATDVKEHENDDNADNANGVHEPGIETTEIVDKLCIPSATPSPWGSSPVPSPSSPSSKRTSKRTSLGASFVGKTFSIRSTVRSKSMMEKRMINTRTRKKTLGSLGSVGGEDDRDKVAFPEADGSSRGAGTSSSTLTPGNTPYARAAASASTADKAAMRGSLGSSKSPKGQRTPPRLQRRSVGSSTAPGSSLAVTAGASRPGKGLDGPRGLLGPDSQPSQALIASTDSSSSPAQTCLGADNVINGPFSPINTLISQDRLAVDFGNLSFSNRGSIMFGGQAPVDNSTQRDDELVETAQAVEPITQGTEGPTSTSTAHAVEEPTTPPPAVPLVSGATAQTPDNSNHETEKEKRREGEREGEGGKDTASSKSSRLSDASGLTRPSITINEDPASPSAPLPSIRVMPMDVERESQKVRSLYESSDGGRFNWQDGGRRVSFAGDLPPLPSEEDPSDVVDPPRLDVPSASDWAASPVPSPPTAPWASSSSLRDDAASYHRPGTRRWGEHERAGGLEDWENLDGVEVDRYGFIKERPARPDTSYRPETSRTVRPGSRSRHFSPRRRNVLTKRPGSAYSSSPLGRGLVGRPPSRKVSARSLHTFTSEYSNASRRSTRSSFRSITNHLPPNRDRKWMDEAGDMLAFPAGGLTDILEYAARMTGKKSTEALKKKELERSEKWRKMAKVVQRFPLEDGGEGEAGGQGQGQGMNFEFDTKNPKLIERTWKGIPDCWRSAAWFSFLASSAKNANTHETDEMLISEFKRLQGISSPDDVQIDLDVPRTVNGHIMFRKRYRGGQRLLFRVLHAISLYFPDTGYVQGMAPLAATLLCYYDEERCFIMMVRLWRYRGLSRLYSPNFEGLLSTLDDFEKHWLAGKDVASKLTELAIDPTAYGTRWYLTLFNLSIPFAAQLRVWDIFMLLGECPPEGELGPQVSGRGSGEVSSQLQHANTQQTSKTNKEKSFLAKLSERRSRRHLNQAAAEVPRGLDILHATSAALIHALRDVLLDSDFENAMKTLTSWIPVKDEDLLMKVVRSEWRAHQKRRDR
ncbi:hypothetical protein B0T20DRAFT_254942 [Sordaria brevicollis]|uniref:Rab-GAP TBC domain-containing protein n=1 Tax=Sordaria brevicollis TaxID=83679 RepID=A0AAE0UB68_SORBR|nr:hypothetical protein B0T20DRAFT_254942 [Sordaria brevicollis]